MRLFPNRMEAARELARNLEFIRDQQPVVIGIPNHGVSMAMLVAEHLEAPLDLIIIQRLHAPRRPDQVVGSLDEHGRITLMQAAARWHHLRSQEMIEPARDVFRVLQVRRGLFRSILPELDLRGRTVAIVDAGVATGATMLGAIAGARARGAAKVIAAAPAGAGASAWQLHEAADLVVIPHSAHQARGVEQFYEHYDEVGDAEVVSLLRHWVESRPPHPTAVKTLVMKISKPDGGILACELDLPPGTVRGSGPFPAVIFAHGMESDARSPRSLPISQRLAARGIIGVRFDFTGHGRSSAGLHAVGARAEPPADATDDETDDAPFGLDEATAAPMLADLRLVVENVVRLTEVDPARIGLNGAGTGGMIALRLAAAEPRLAAMVIRGPVCGREPDAARLVRAPTLLIHAELDTALSRTVHSINAALAAPHQLLRIPDSSRLFSDPISREIMITASIDWFIDHLLPVGSHQPADSTGPAPPGPPA
jgi:predicted phosphoribosyltransferase/dienelactone hydrolase